nr:uncharacterized protein LOC112022823 [Quercus suber]
MAEEFVSTSHKQMNEEDGQHIAAMETFTLAEQRIKDLNTKLIKATREKKSAKAALEAAERQAESQRQQLRQTEDQLTIAKEQIRALKKKLEEAEEVADKAEQAVYENLTRAATADAAPSSTVPPKEAEQVDATEKEKELSKEPMKLPPTPTNSSKEKGAS